MTLLTASLENRLAGSTNSGLMISSYSFKILLISNNQSLEIEDIVMDFSKYFCPAYIHFGSKKSHPIIHYVLLHTKQTPNRTDLRHEVIRAMNGFLTY